MPQTAPIPSLSVILLLPEDYESRRRAVSFLTRQTVREKIELVLVLHMRVDIELDEVQLRSFGSYQLVRLADFIDPGQTRCPGAHRRLRRGTRLSRAGLGGGTSSGA